MPTPSIKPKVIISDVDKTLTERVTWYTLIEQLGGSSMDLARIFSSYLNNKITYKEAKFELFKMINQNGKIKKKQLQQIFSDVHLKGEAFAVINELKERGYKLCLISSSIDLFVETVAKRFDIDYWYANSELVFDENGYWVDFHFDKHMAELKVKQLENFMHKTQYQQHEIIALGDDDNDVGLFREIPGISVNSHNDILTELAWKNVAYLPRVIQVIESIKG